MGATVASGEISVVRIRGADRRPPFDLGHGRVQLPGVRRGRRCSTSRQPTRPRRRRSGDGRGAGERSGDQAVLEAAAGRGAVRCSSRPDAPSRRSARARPRSPERRRAGPPLGAVATRAFKRLIRGQAAARHHRGRLQRGARHQVRDRLDLHQLRPALRRGRGGRRERRRDARQVPDHAALDRRVALPEPPARAARASCGRRTTDGARSSGATSRRRTCSTGSSAPRRGRRGGAPH